ncbi:MAG: hypothetical protein ABSH20_05990 [Tepidisphaeraceae bacterium]|jgi:hypothetical protein
MSQQDMITIYREKILRTMQNHAGEDPESSPPVPAAVLGERMLDEAIALPESTRHALMHDLTPEDSTLLLGIASGKAVCAVREGTPDELRYGLIALILEDRRHDWRETLRLLCLLNHSAGKLGVNLEAIYQGLKPLASTETAHLISGYFEGGERDIRAMGYKEDTSPDGFIYTRIG